MIKRYLNPVKSSNERYYCNNFIILNQILIYFTFLMIYFSSLSLSHSRSSDDGKEWNFAKKTIAAKFEEGDCAGTWNIIWKWAKDNNKEARSMLAKSIIYGDLRPPGYIEDKVSHRKLLIEIIIFGYERKDEKFEFLLDEKSMIELGFADLSEVVRCLKSKIKRSICLESAIRNGVLPSFLNLASIIDSQAKASHDRAFCNPLPPLLRF